MGRGISIVVGVAAAVLAQGAIAQEFNWRAHQGKTVTFLVNNNPIGTTLVKLKPEFEKLTGITVKVDGYQEQQMRQRLVTVMNAKSDEVDLFMSLSSREGLQFAKAGWYADLNSYLRGSVAKDYDFKDLSAGMVADVTYDGKVMGLPLNVEGPVLYYRRDLLQKCGVAVPNSLADLTAAAAKLKACDSNVTPFVSRGLKPAAPFTFSVYLHNHGGSYMKDRKSQLCSPAGQAALGEYSQMLRDYGPPGVVNYSFPQISSLYREGRAVFAFESTNELRSIMDGGARLADTGIMPLPGGPGGSKPTVIGWSMSISAHSRNKDAAWYFLQWATSRGVQEKMALEGIAPPRASVASGAEFKKWIDEQPVRRDWIAALTVLNRTGISEVGYPIVANPASREPIGQAINELILGQKTVSQACADADNALNALIAKE